jgi:hypothetical protein
MTDNVLTITMEQTEGEHVAESPFEVLPYSIENLAALLAKHSENLSKWELKVEKY